MDNTLEYIDMCQKATEIQELWTPEEGDYRFWITGNDAQIVDWVNIQCLCDRQEDYVWLLRQDQLQFIYASWIAKQLEMRDANRFIKESFLDFSSWLGKQYLNEKFTCVPTNCFDTGEKLWMAFIMQEMFNKRWIDGEWGEI
jgi:hypothetical protein